ncbi:MAG: DUF1993 domain-containing protein [Burkholderiales bacterium]|nr:DUF1993 domain-containing protein [Burkholderiales bacterium]
MAIGLHQISAPVFVRHLKGMVTCLKKAQALYREKKYDEATLLAYRFYPDMFTFAKQVQIATDHARTCTALMAGVDAPKIEDNEKSLEELIGRVEKSIAFIETISAAQLDGAEDKSVTLKMRDRELNMTALELLLNRSVPNFYFHATTAYDILRHNGVELGKRDFMGAA